MKLIITIIIGITLSLFLASCGARHFNYADERIIQGTGTVSAINANKGIYGITADDGRRYEPVNLPDDFKEEGAYLEFKALPRLDVKSNNWGKPVELIYFHRTIKISR